MTVEERKSRELMGEELTVEESMIGQKDLGPTKGEETMKDLELRKGEERMKDLERMRGDEKIKDQHRRLRQG